MARPSKAPARSVSLPGRIWEKPCWIFGPLFLGLTFWIWSRFGEWNLVRFYAAVFTVLGVGILVYAVRRRRMAEESLHWLPVRARIVRSEVTEEVSRSPGSSFSMGPQHMLFYHPEIEYEYEVGGRTCHSNNLIAVHVNFSSADAQAWVAKYPAGAVVTARRHPEKPQLSVLEPGLAGFESRYRIPFIAGAGFFTFGTVTWLLVSWLT
ncbi:MAG: hypothetical protein KatS3mg005_1974 [Bryobacteraceae bacterium]|nr:MAG: hypothetical protein KatS3mg005_1974 [Bryobacteraceae bacterium]